jgi:uncharacterized protein
MRAWARALAVSSIAVLFGAAVARAAAAPAPAGAVSRDGAVMLAGAVVPAGAVAPNLGGVWLVERPQPEAKTTTGQTPPLKPEAAALYAKRKRARASGTHADDATTHDSITNDPVAACLPQGIPRLLNTPQPIHILQKPQQITVLYQANHQSRQFYIDEPVPSPDNAPDITYNGSSYARWSGNALVVDTISQNGLTWLDDVGLPHSEALKVVERYERIDADHLRVTVTITDAQTFTAPWDMQVTYKRRPDLRFKEDVCSEKFWHPGATTRGDGTTELHRAAARGDVAATKALLAQGADPAAVTDTGVTPLVLACEAGSAEVVKLLLNARADPNQTLLNGETPLMMAARTGSVAVIEALLAHGAKIDEREKLRGTTALMWAAASSNAHAVRALIRHGANIHARSETTAPGRQPYLADSGRARLQEFIEKRGQGGSVVEIDTPEAKARLATEIEQTKQILAQFPTAAAEQPSQKRWGGLTPLIFATREGSLDTVKALLDSGAKVNQTSEFGWSPLLVATHDRFYRLGVFLLERGADPNIANEGGWNPLYLATDNRNIEAGDYPTRKPDMDHLEYIQRLLAAGANPNLRMRSSTETRTVFTHQWLLENGATPFLRAAQSGDVPVMKLLLEHGADPAIPTFGNVTPLMVACGIGWVEGVTYEWSPQSTLDAVKMILARGADVNAQDALDGRTALMGAAHKGRNDIIELLVRNGADLGLRDMGSRDSIHALAGTTWQAIDYADGLVRVGVQSAISHPESAALLRQLMAQRGLSVPAEGRTLASICITDICK